jgi:hypothetical protein
MSFISNFKDKIAQSIGDKIDTVKLSVIDKVSAVLGYLLFVFIAIFIAMSVLIFLGIGLGEVFYQWMDSRPGAFFATAGVYILLVVLLFIFRQNVVDGFASVFIKMLTDQGDDEDDDHK